jgi:hypothetical protein
LLYIYPRSADVDAFKNVYQNLYVLLTAAKPDGMTRTVAT